MKISDKLRTFIENRYERLLQNEELEEKEKVKHQRNKETRKKKLTRSLKKEINELESATQKGWISDNQYQTEKSKLFGKAEQTKSNYRKEDKEHIKPFGKTQYDRNSFICLSWYLIKKETNKRDSIIYREVSDFLAKKKFKKRNDRQYTENDIKRVIYTFEAFEVARPDIESYFDYMYSEFKQE